MVAQFLRMHWHGSPGHPETLGNDGCTAIHECSRLHCSQTFPSAACSCLQESLPVPPKSKKRAVDEAVLWGYVPALDPRGLQRGLLHHGDPARMRRAVAKLLSGERTVVAAVGGSISVGRGSASQVQTESTMVE